VIFLTLEHKAKVDDHVGEVRRHAAEALPRHVVELMRVHVDLKVAVPAVEAVLRASQDRLSVIRLEQVALRSSQLLLFRVHHDADRLETLALSSTINQCERRARCNDTEMYRRTMLLEVCMKSRSIWRGVHSRAGE